MFKNHATFSKAKHLQRYLFPHACFTCRKVFRKPHSKLVRVCPQCAAPMVILGRKFHTPRLNDREQWKKVELLVNHGFRFESVYRATEFGGKVAVPYPRRLSEVPTFVAEFRGQALQPEPLRPNDSGPLSKGAERDA